MEEKLQEHLNYIEDMIKDKMRKAKNSGALSGEENEHALIRACTKLAIEEMFWNEESREIYKNIKHFA